MTGALVILAAMIVIGLLLFITDVKYYRHHHDGKTINDSSELKDDNAELQDNEICCGQHLICEKNSLSIVSDEVIYYEDEELDRFAGRTPDSYSEEETEEFREILLTLLPQDITGWAKSITLRNIQLPPEIKDELFLLVSELRNQ